MSDSTNTSFAQQELPTMGATPTTHADRPTSRGEATTQQPVLGIDELSTVTGESASQASGSTTLVSEMKRHSSRPSPVKTVIRCQSLPRARRKRLRRQRMDFGCTMHTENGTRIYKPLPEGEKSSFCYNMRILGERVGMVSRTNRSIVLDIVLDNGDIRLEAACRLLTAICPV